MKWALSKNSDLNATTFWVLEEGYSGPFFVRGPTCTPAPNTWRRPCVALRLFEVGFRSDGAWTARFWLSHMLAEPGSG